MAIKSVNSVKNSNIRNTPESLPSIPESNVDHQSTSTEFHNDTSINLRLYTSFDEAKQACERIYLKPGEAHTEFYKEDGEYHCVVAIGNIFENTEHLYLTDSGNEFSIDERLDHMHDDFVQLSKQFTYLTKDVSSLHINVEEFESNVNTSLLQIRDSIGAFEYAVSHQIDSIGNTVNDVVVKVEDISSYVSTQINDISSYVSEFDSRVSNIESNIDNLTSDINVINEHLNNHDSSINDINKNISSIDLSIHEIENKINDIDASIDVINGHLTSHDESIDNFNKFAEKTNSSINDLTNRIINLDSSVDEIKNSIEEEIYDINDNLNVLNSSVENIINSTAEHIDVSIKELDEKVNKLDSSITEINQTVLENAQYVSEAINDINSSINEIDNDIDTISSTVNTHLAQLDASVEENTNNIDNIQNNVQQINNELDEINSSISDIKSTIEANVANINEHLEVLDNSVNEIISYTENISTHLNEVVNELVDTNSSISDMKIFINDVSLDLNEKIENINSEIDSLDLVVDTHTVNINDISSRLSLTNESIDVINTNIDLINDNIDNINSSILSVKDLIDEHSRTIDIAFDNIDNIDSSINELKDKDASINSEILGIKNRLVEIDLSIGEVKTQIDEHTDDINNIIESLSNTDSSVLEINDKVNNVQEAVNNVSSNLNNTNTSIGEINIRIDEIQEDIYDVTTLIDDVNASINTINETTNNLQDDIYDVTTLIDEVSTYANAVNEKVDTLEENANNQLENIGTSLENINNSLNVINTSINGYEEQIIDIKFKQHVTENQVNAHNTSINVLEENTAIIDSSLTDIMNRVESLTSSINYVEEGLLNEHRHNSIQDVSIHALDSSIQGILDTMRCKCANITEAIQHNAIQDVSINLINATLDEIQNYLNEFTPIEDASIYSLFHDDIYTINLCCYTKAGYIQIEDHIAGVNAGGNNKRVAECTPFNEYKTYVHGDNVDFTAVANEGYKFLCWYIDANIYNPYYENTISYSFGDDINVIGSMLDGTDPDMLQHGYTAKFKRLHRLKVSINQLTNDRNTYVKFFDDSLDIYITEPGSARRKVNLEDALTGHVYFDDDSKVQIVAKPDTYAYHEFNKYKVNNGREIIEVNDSTYTSFNTNTDLIIDAYFMEYWITVHGDATQEYAGRVYINGETEFEQVSPDNVNYYLGGSIVTISASGNPGYGFNRWSSNKPSLAQFKSDIIYPYNINSNYIKMRVNKSVKEYELVAYFNSGVTVHFVEYYYDDTYTNVYVKKQFNDGDIITPPDVLPVRPGYIVDTWICEEPEYIINESTIDKDLRFYAKWAPELYDVSLYVKYRIYEHLTNITYDTPFNNLQISTPDLSVGEEFVGWMADFSGVVIDPDAYRIQNNVRFDASILTLVYDVHFIVEGEVIKETTVNYNTRLGEIAPENPYIEGYIFKGWTINGEFATDSWLIQENSVFIAQFVNACNTEFYVDNIIINSSIVEVNTLFENIKPEDPEKPGYIFEYWTLNDTDVSVSDSYQIIDDTSFIANYTINQYTLSFFVDDALYDRSILDYNTVMNDARPADPTKPGYMFIDWYNSNGKVLGDRITEDTSFIAIFEKVYFTIGFQTDSGNFELDGKDLVGKTLNYSTSEPIDASFEGWYNANDHSTKLSSNINYPKEIQSNDLPLTLDAKFVQHGTSTFKLCPEGYKCKDGDIVVIGVTGNGEYSGTLNMMANETTTTGTTYTKKTTIDNLTNEIDVDAKNEALTKAGELLIQKIKIHIVGTAYALEAINENGNSSGFYCWISGNSIALDNTVTIDDLQIKHTWNITVDNNGVANITNCNASVRVLSYNVTSPRFACYGNYGQTQPYIFKEQSATREYWNNGIITIISDENAFSADEEITVYSINNTTLAFNGWNDDKSAEEIRTIVVNKSWTYMPYYGDFYKITFARSYEPNYTYFEPTNQDDINVDVDGYVSNNVIYEGTIGTPTHWIASALHNGQCQFYTLPFFDRNTTETWYPSDHWVPVFTTHDYFLNFNKCILTYCVNNDQTRGGSRIRMVAIDENGNEIAYAYGEGTINGEVSKEVGTTLTELEFKNWYAIENGAETRRLFKDTANANIIEKAKVRMTLKMNKLSLFITSFAINGTKYEN